MTRQALGRYAYALDLLPVAERNRSESLAGLLLVLLDTAREPGFGGQRLAATLLWQDRLDEALEIGHADEPILAAFIQQDREQPWDRSILERLQAMMRSLATTLQDPAPRHLSEILLALILGEEPGRSSVAFLACILEGETPDALANAAEKELPSSWHRALRYAQIASHGPVPSGFRRWLIRLRSKL